MRLRACTFVSRASRTLCAAIACCLFMVWSLSPICTRGLNYSRKKFARGSLTTICTRKFALRCITADADARALPLALGRARAGPRTLTKPERTADPNKTLMDSGPEQNPNGPRPPDRRVVVCAESSYTNLASTRGDCVLRWKKRFKVRAARADYGAMSNTKETLFTAVRVVCYGSLAVSLCQVTYACLVIWAF